MHLRRDRNGKSTTIATNIEIADTLIGKTRGLMFRRSLPDDFALVFTFSTIKMRDVHMMFVFTPLDVCWVKNNRVERVELMRPFFSYARAQADMIIELPAGGADDIRVGDEIHLIK